VTLDFNLSPIQKRVICKNKGMYFGFPLMKKEINIYQLAVKYLRKEVSLWVCSAGIKTPF